MRNYHPMRSHLLPLFFILVFSSTTFASEYQRYENLLSKISAIPDHNPVECEFDDPRYWMDKAQNIISVEPIRNEIPDLTADEVMVIRNLLISQAYNRLFMHSLKIQNKEKPDVKYIWLAAGSQASVTVGHALQEGLASKYPYDSRQRKIFRRLESLHGDLPATSAVLLRTIAKVKKKTAENNWRVYSDIFWQHLAYTSCGYNEVVSLNKILIEERREANDRAGVDHYERFLQVWNDMDHGRYVEANMKLIYIEQHNILQKHMYNGLDAKTANILWLFNSMAKADLQGPHGRKIVPFTEYALSKGLYPNLSYFPTRYKWMKYVVREQARYLQELATVPNIQSALERSLKESYQVVNDYLQLAQ